MKRVNCLNTARSPAVWAASILLAFGLNSAVACPKCNQPPKYTVIELQPLPGQGGTAVSGLPGCLNSRGQVVGASYADPSVAVSGCLWQKGRVTELPPGAAPWTVPWAVNDSGQIFGASTEPFWINSHADVLKGPRWVQLPDLNATYCNAEAWGVNNRSTAIGTAWKSLGLYGSEPSLPVVWRRGKIEALPILDSRPGHVNSGQPFAINDRDQIVGRSGDSMYDEQGNFQAPFYFRATLWEHGEAIDLSENHDCSEVRDINNAGVAAGVVFDYDPSSPDGMGPLLTERPCAWTKATGLVDIGTLPGYPFSTAYAINDGGEIVGFGGAAWGQEDKAVLWRHGAIYDLNQCVPAGSDWILYRAFAINARGQIVAFGVNPHTGAGGTFLLDPQWCKRHKPMED